MVKQCVIGERQNRQWGKQVAAVRHVARDAQQRKSNRRRKKQEENAQCVRCGGEGMPMLKENSRQPRARLAPRAQTAACEVQQWLVWKGMNEPVVRFVVRCVAGKGAVLWQKWWQRCEKSGHSKCTMIMVLLH